MANKIREAIDYGGYRERMDPYLERKLASPESLYAKNPAFVKGVEDVERLAVARFKKVVDKLKQAKGYETLTPAVIQRIYMEEMSKVPMVVSIENQHKDELEELATEAALMVTETPSNYFQIDAQLNRGAIDTSNFQYEPPDDEEEEEEKEKDFSSFSFDVEDLTPEEELELEKHKRNLVNALIQGAAKKGHYSFQIPEIKEKLDEIDSRLYPAYLGIMAVNDLLYFTQEQMIEMMSATGNGIAGKVQLEDADDDAEGGDEGGGEEEDRPDTKIVAQGLIFPILVHEIVKGIESANLRPLQSQNPEVRQKVKAQVDLLSNEPMQIRIGPEVVDRFRDVLPDEMFEPNNKGLINWFKIELSMIPIREFFSMMAKVISDKESEKKEATQKFTEIMKSAIQKKEEYENWKKEKNIGDENDDEGLDDFLGSLGISRPK